MITRNYRLFLSILGLVLLCGLFISQNLRAEDPAAFTEGQKEQIQQIIKQYLLDNPQIIMDSVQAYQQQQAEQQDKIAEQKVGEHLGALTSKDAPSAGNPDGDITIVEFFDYNCGYCKRAFPDIQQVLSSDKNVRFVFQDMPILGPTSLTAAKWALAAHKQGKYFEYHAELMKHNGAKNESELSKLAEKIGLDVEKMKKDAGSREVKEAIDKNMDMAREIGIQGTPAFILDGALMRGYLGREGMKDAIKQARAKKEG